MSERTLADISNALTTRTTAGFLYGSGAGPRGANRDIDLVIVCDELGKQAVRREVALLQSSVDTLIHAVIISPEELAASFTLRSIVTGAKRMW